MESPLGARNAPVPRPRPDEFWVIIAWLDESSPYFLPDPPVFWNPDVQAWEGVIADRDANLFAAAVFDSPTDRPGPGDAIVPPGRGIPEPITLVDIERNPSAAVIVDNVLRLIPANIVPSVIQFQMDGSESFGRGSIGPAFPEALQLLRDRYADVRPRPQVFFLDLDGERWLQWLTAGVRQYVPTM